MIFAYQGTLENSRKGTKSMCVSWILVVPFVAVIEHRGTPSRARVYADGNAELHERGTEETMLKL